MNKERLVYILHDIRVGGVEVALLSAIPALNRRYELKVIVLGSIDLKLIAGLSPEEREVFVTFDYKVYLYPFKLKAITDFIVALSPKYVICSLWRASWIGISIKKRLPEVRLFSFIHNTKFFHFADSYFSAKAIRIADYVWADSTSTFAFIKDKFGLEQKIRIISLLTHETPAENPMLTQQGELRDNTIKFLFLGRINRVKNLPLAIKLIQELAAKGYDVLFDVYGRAEDGYEESLRLVEENNLASKVSFKGEIDPELRFGLFPQYNFYLQLSDVEGMAMSVAEAMQNGLVCIVTPVGEIPNYADDMKSAIFVHAANAEQWQKSLEKVDAVLSSDTLLYKSISQGCFSNFSNKRTYTESIIENIEAS